LRWEHVLTAASANALLSCSSRAFVFGRFSLSKQIKLNQYLKPAAFRIAFLICVLITLGALPRANSDTSSIHWQAVTEAQVKVDDKTPLTWNIYQPDKKNKKDSNLFLILLGHRYVLLDTKAKLVYEVPLAQVHMQGKEIDTDGLPGAARQIPSSNWMSRDVGSAELIQMTLGDYGRTITLALPHIPDIRLGIY
jgi:hypothetical protein